MMSFGAPSAHRTPATAGSVRGDAGATLLELVVAMAIMTIFLAIFTGAMLSMYHSTSKVEGITNTSAQVNIAFSKLDSSLRYASAISPPATDTDGNPIPDDDGNWYVAFQSTFTGSPVCTRLQLNTADHQLRQRTWDVDKTTDTASNVTAWRPLASSIYVTTDGSGETVPPFVFTAAGGVVRHEQLRVALSAKTGSGDRETTSDRSATFTAFNASDGTATTGVCDQVAVGTP